MEPDPAPAGDRPDRPDRPDRSSDANRAAGVESAAADTDEAADATGTADLGRRDLLAGGATAGAAALAGCGGLLGGSGSGSESGSDSDSRAPATEPLADERARELAAAYAPDLYFGVGERLFPADPREWASESDGQTVLDGFDAFDGYAGAYDPGGAPPNPTVFYRVVSYAETDLVAVQFWLYSAFDQFSVNFHWHDWELLQVFVDTGAGDSTGEPVLFAASAHSRKVPNNEFLDPRTDRASVISEVGSHSSALGVNASPGTFERVPGSGTADIADISNGVLAIADLPAAYGLPRGEGFRLPFSMPELDGSPVHEHPDLPNVTREHLVPASMTVDSFAGLPSPPADLPLRETGLHLAFEGRAADASTDADADYTLEPMAEMDVEAFTGPQLSFAFAVPKFAEDAIASHLTTTDSPKGQPRYENPVEDVTDPRHRSALEERFGIRVTGLAGDIVGLLREATDSEDAPGSNGVETTEVTAEGVALLESDPAAVPTFNGAVALRDVPEGDHRLTVNGAGVAPYSQRVGHEADGEATVAGAGEGGEVVLAANEDAVKVRGETAPDVPAVSRVGVADDFAGAVFDGRPGEPDEEGRFAVYAHRAGAYTAEVEDEEGVLGAFRVNPRADQSTATIADLRTGKASLTSFLVTLLTETTAQASVFADGDADGIDEVDVPDSTAEQPGSARDRVEAVTGRSVDGGDGTATATATPTESGTGGASGSGSGGGSGSGSGGGSDSDGGGGGSTGDGRGSDGGPLPLSGLLRALEAATLAAARADDAARAGNATAADRRLRGLRQRVTAITDALERTAEDLPEGLAPLVENRVPQAKRRVEQAIEADS